MARRARALNVEAQVMLKHFARPARECAAGWRSVVSKLIHACKVGASKARARRLQQWTNGAPTFCNREKERLWEI